MSKDPIRVAAGFAASRRKGKAVERRAARRAAATKGPEERHRAALMAHWTIKYGKNDARNPYSRENWRG